MSASIETDYLIVGAGAAGLAFADSLCTNSDNTDIVIVDRRHSPGGHWNNAYPFVRLHQPSATYGVNSRALGEDRIETVGPNAGFYERATGPEINGYFHRVLDDLQATGRVRFYGGSDYVGDWSQSHAFTSSLAQQTTTVRVRRKVIDSTYLQTSFPSRDSRSFGVDADTLVLPVRELPDVVEPPGGFTVVGCGKTAMDACCWLLDNGVDADRIRWVRPRDAWLLDRAAYQPLELLPTTLERQTQANEAIAAAESVDDLYRRAEACLAITRLDARVTPTMFRGAILSPTERAALQQIERVVRLGHVVHVGSRTLVLADGEVSTAGDDLYVDCTAYGFRAAPIRPIFEPNRVTIQSLIGGFTTYNAALIAFVESMDDNDNREKNRLCVPVPQPTEPIDWLASHYGALRSSDAHRTAPDLSDWQRRSRLNLISGIGAHVDKPEVQATLARARACRPDAQQNAKRLLAEAGRTSSSQSFRRG